MPVNTSREPQTDIVVMAFSGLVTADDLKKSIRDSAALTEKGVYLKSIANFLNCEIKIAPEEIASVIKVFDEIDRNHIAKATAIIVEGPKNTALAMLYQMLTKSIHESKVFCTEKAARDWINTN